MTWNVVRVILEYVVFLHDAIGVGLFVVIAHHVEKRVCIVGCCSPVNEAWRLVSCQRQALQRTLYVDGRGEVRRRFIGERANGILF